MMTPVCIGEIAQEHVEADEARCMLLRAGVGAIKEIGPHYICKEGELPRPCTKYRLNGTTRILDEESLDWIVFTLLRNVRSGEELRDTLIRILRSASRLHDVLPADAELQLLKAEDVEAMF